MYLWELETKIVKREVGIINKNHFYPCYFWCKNVLWGHGQKDLFCIVCKFSGTSATEESGEMMQGSPPDPCSHLIWRLQLLGWPPFGRECFPWPPAHLWPTASQRCPDTPRGKSKRRITEPCSSGSQFWQCPNYLEGFLNTVTGPWSQSFWFRRPGGVVLRRCIFNKFLDDTDAASPIALGPSALDY